MTKQSCHLTWKIPKDDGGSPILHYVVEKMDLSRGTWSDAGMSTTLNHDVTRLTHKKEYLFRVKAVNAIGESEPLEISRSVVIKNEFGKPAVQDFPSIPGSIIPLTNVDVPVISQTNRALRENLWLWIGIKSTSNWNGLRPNRMADGL